MRSGSARWRRLGSSVIPVAFAAALPLVQWCTLCADETQAACPVEHAAAAAASGVPACTRDVPACERGVEEGQCPFAGTTHRQFCVGGPMGGAGVRPHAPELKAPGLQPALPASEPPALEPARETQRVQVQAEARPPTRSRARRPPVRGPPSA